MVTLNSKEFIEDWFDLQKKRKDNPEEYRLRSTGIRALDKVLGGGVEFGQFVIYGGEQKVGKSTMLECTAKQFGLDGDPFGFFSLEMHNAALATRLLCDMSGVEKDSVRRIEWTNSEWDKIKDEAKIVSDFDAWWTYGVSSVRGIREVLTKVKKETGVQIKAIFVDYIQLMQHPGKSMRHEELSAISREFKRMSIDMGEPMLVFVAAQVNRESAKSHIINANSFLGTGALERDMDIGVIIHNVKDENNGSIREDVRQLTVVGSRETGLGSVPVRFNGSTSSIRDMEVPDNEITVKYWEKEASKIQRPENF